MEAEQAVANVKAIYIRWMIRRDMTDVVRIERESFDCSWTEDDFLRCLRQRNTIGMVCELMGNVEGYMIYELHESRLHILNFAVSPLARRIGLGRSMVEKLIGKLSSHRRKRITLAVRETNLGAQLFFKATGFRATKVLRGYYEMTGEDGYAMKYEICEPVKHPVPW
jgi:ribosomal-protein-alanine N-acetyltransferase